MFALYFAVLLSYTFLLSYSCDTSTIRLEPKLAISNATSATIFVCTKGQDDGRGFEVSLSPNVSEEHVRISISQLNSTAIEIIIQSLGYVGALTLRCSSEGVEDAGARSDIVIGKTPGLLMRVERCTVHFDEYIDCTISAPVMIRAIVNRLDNEFQFSERLLFSRSRVYRPDPKLVAIDPANQRLTFRWMPERAGYFPSRLKMNVLAKIRYFGSSSYIMDMNPIFQISSSFVATRISSTSVQVLFDHHSSSLLTICHGNATNEKRRQSDEEEIRILEESNATSILVSDLNPDTWYRLCFHCRRDVQFDTTSSVKCHRYKTLQTSNRVWPLAIKMTIACLALVIIGILCWKGCDRAWIQEKLRGARRRKEPHITVIHVPRSSTPLMPPEFLREETPSGCGQ